MVNRVWYNGTRNFIEIQNKYSKDRPFDSMDRDAGNIRKTAYYNVMLPIPLSCNY
jgi:hypothetical protein